MAKHARPSAKISFEERYPHVAKWIDGCGWIEMGNIDGFSPFILALDEGGMVWEGKVAYPSIDDAFADLERGLTKVMKELFGDE